MGNKTVATWIPESMADDIQRLIQQGKYTNYSDFIRAAIREKLEAEK